MLTLASEPLMVEDPAGEVFDWVEKNINPKYYVPWLRRSFPGLAYTWLTWPTGYSAERPFKINRFYWPLGASRWAYGHFLVDAERLDRIRDEAYTNDGTVQREIKLIMDSPFDPEQDAPERLEVDVYLLPPTPLSSVELTEEPGDINNLFLITVVDERYYWWNKATPLLEFTDETTWTDAFDKVETALDITLTVDTIDAKYLRASPQLNLSYEVIPPFFDALAYNVGHRVVRKFDGTVHTQNYETALAARQADRTTNKDRFRSAGGIRMQDWII